MEALGFTLGEHIAQVETARVCAAEMGAMAKLANLRTERHGLRAPTVPQPYPYRAPTPTLTSSLNTDPVPNSGPIPNPDPIPNPNPSRMTLIPAL